MEVKMLSEYYCYQSIGRKEFHWEHKTLIKGASYFGY